MKQNVTSAKIETPLIPPAAGSGQTWWVLAAASCVLPWLSQPPFAWWPLAAIAVVPLLLAAAMPTLTRKQYLVLYLAASAYWALTLQGLRLANPLIYPCWIALACYLAIYPVALVVVVRRSIGIGIPMMLSAPIAWVGMECVRNYLLTGISAAMLGHAFADVPAMIQVADLGGTYAVSWVVMLVNTAIALIAQWVIHNRQSRDHQQRFPFVSCLIASAVLLLTVGYGVARLNDILEPSNATIALIGRNEVVEYDQDRGRELELFDAYAKESIRAFEQTELTIHAVVWPESMFTGQIPWMAADPDSAQGGALALELGLSVAEAQALAAEHRSRFQFRAASLQSFMALHNGDDQLRPDLIGGCAVIDDGPTTKIYSGIVHVGGEGKVRKWYGKMHLVMFGEYIPLVKHIPWVRDWIPKNLGLTAGETPQRFTVGAMTLCPNICIETAVERVAINHLRVLRRDTEWGLPDAIVTVTNDGWFDDSSVVQHHKRCAQLVAVACRRPILSAANNGPTVWIDSCGRVVQELHQGENGWVIAQPEIDRRTSWAVRIGDWPARLCAVFFIAILIHAKFRRQPIMDPASGT